MMKVPTRRVLADPNLSAKYPPGICIEAYGMKKNEVTRPVWMLDRPNCSETSFEIGGKFRFERMKEIITITTMPRT